MRNALVSGGLIGATLGLAHFGHISHLTEIFLYLAAIAMGGYHWVREGIEELLQERKIGIEILMIAATIGSAILGMWDEAALLVFLYGMAEGLEEYTYAKTKHSIKKLLNLAPKQARILRHDKELILPAEELAVGDILIVKPGESIPTDGVITKGKSSVNEASLTGESIPAEKKEGDRVFAATINQEGALLLKATATFADNTLARLIHMVEEAQEKKGKTQLFIEKFGNRYSPLVLFTALLLIAVPPLFGFLLTEWATRAVVFLVAAAPCALVMSTPVAIAAGIGKAGRTGILIKGGIHLENLGKIKAIAFDKTGTLTMGDPVVTDIITLSAKNADILRLAYSIEKYSEHPLAKAIVRKAQEAGIDNLEVKDFMAIAGYGTQGKIGEETIFVGKPGLFKNFNRIRHSIPQIERLKSEGKTVIIIGTQETIAGAIAIRDEIRPQGKRVIKKLRRMGIKPFMVTGDSQTVAQAIAKELGIDEIRADLTPEDKVAVIKNLKRTYENVAMVGDGINDAPALATATVGIAMGAAGTDTAIEAANVALMADNLAKLLHAIHLGKRAKKISLQNIIFSLLVLAVLVPSALAGVLSVALAVFLHESSELLAVANGLRMARN